jgi:ketosteroid isomerase-like protein
MSEHDDFDELMKARTRAADAYVQGDVAPLDVLEARVGPVTFFGPNGAFVTGAEAVRHRYAKDAGNFAPGGENRLEILHSGASGDLGYWVGFQHAVAHLRGKPEPVPMKLRITELFRREAGEWRLVHRHAEMVTGA